MKQEKVTQVKKRVNTRLTALHRERKKHCPHNEVEVWMMQMHRTNYGRNKQGELEELSDSIKQTYHTSATIHCRECETSLQYEKLQFSLDREKLLGYGWIEYKIWLYETVKEYLEGGERR